MPITDFTYNSYFFLLNFIIDNGYYITNYHNYHQYGAPCILRHDIDYDVHKAFVLAEYENKKNISSTYFVMLNTDFYNVFSSPVNTELKEMTAMGHEIGLHFDETRYQFSDINELSMYIMREVHLLQEIIEKPVTVVSMHRPSRIVMDADISIPGVVNSYSREFFSGFKYLSDSRHYWRENVEDIVKSKRHNRLHILTHPFWYTDKVESCRDKLLKFILAGNKERYNMMSNNFSNLSEFIQSL